MSGARKSSKKIKNRNIVVNYSYKESDCITFVRYKMNNYSQKEEKQEQKDTNRMADALTYLFATMITAEILWIFYSERKEK